MSDERDPLEERDDAREEVERKRLVEAIDEETEIGKMHALLQDERVRDLLWKIIERCGIFADPMSPNFGNVAYGLGKAAIGKWLIVEINDAEPNAWLAMQLKSGLKQQTVAREQATKRLRKSRSP